MLHLTTNNALPTLAHLPQSSGVYQYFDANGHLLYVGKAKNLKKRIKSYFTPSTKLSPRIASMVSQVSEIKTFITPNEQDALILENSLIKSLKPKYNILLRDDKTYPYIYIDYNEDFPTLEITRTLLKKRNITYFGPFSTGARDLLESILQSLPLVQKKSCLRGKKACLFYQIKRCLAPCEGKTNKEQYAQLLEQAIDLLQHKKKLIAILESKMQTLAQHYAFEEAAKIRDSIAKITQMQAFSHIDLLDYSNLDVFVFCADTNHYGIMMKLFIRNGRISSSDFLSIHDESLQSLTTESSQADKSQVLHSLYTQALLNHYKTPAPLLPDSILLPYEIGIFEEKIRLEKILQKRTGKKITILQPQRGKKHELINIARTNAKELMRLQEQQKQHYIQELQALRELFALSNLPYRIEIFDTSHHSGSACVGGMVVYENDGFLKNAYRHYHLQGTDEYAQMREMLTRRALDFESNPPPNLWLLDGGAAQITIAKEILESAGVQIDILGIAKHKLNGRAHRAKGSASDYVYMLDSKHTAQEHIQTTQIRLPPSDKRLQFLQKLRDEAHRYAITFHRNKKLKNLTQAQALGIEKNLSVAQIQKLLRIYGDFAHIRDLTPIEITQALRQRHTKP
ncbi:excinuclease ABC subunit UvrC [Helicobacter equorum]|uniref:excinuclease ABC subunit UvrC n=1 Tax=Helicobacter equorum TaxID=361872 RepID=UPI000CF0150E|nr:excinuclease ABC subunit UvrC [Helicobacter equorum]